MRLNQIRMSDLIEISCGHFESLHIEDEQEAQKVASSLLLEYKSIVSPSGLQSMIVEKEDEAKLNAKILMLKVCSTLNTIGYTEETKAIMKEWMPDYNKTGDDLVNDVQSKLREAEFMLQRNNDTKEESRPPTEDEIRSSFDTEIAFLMTYFKMQIDIERTNAAVYANIVHQAQEDIKQRMRKRG